MPSVRSLVTNQLWRKTLLNMSFFCAWQICGGTGTLSTLLFSPLSVIQTVIHIHSFIHSKTLYNRTNYSAVKWLTNFFFSLFTFSAPIGVRYDRDKEINHIASRRRAPPLVVRHYEVFYTCFAWSIHVRTHKNNRINLITFPRHFNKPAALTGLGHTYAKLNIFKASYVKENVWHFLTYVEKMTWKVSESEESQWDQPSDKRVKRLKGGV